MTTIRAEEDAGGVGLCVDYWRLEVVGLGGVDRRIAAAVVHQDRPVSVGDPDVVVLARGFPLHSKVGELQPQHHPPLDLDRLRLFKVVGVVTVWVVRRRNFIFSIIDYCYWLSLSLTIFTTWFWRAKWGVLGCLPESRASDRVSSTSDLVSVASVAAAVDHQRHELSSPGSSIILTLLVRKQNFCHKTFRRPVFQQQKHRVGRQRVEVVGILAWILSDKDTQ